LHERLAGPTKDANVELPILHGKLRGKRWLVESFINLGFWLGTYEHKKQSLFVRTVTEGAVVYDVGAHVGFYTLLASVMVGPTGTVVAFEPLPRNLYYLHRHLSLNRCENVKVVEAAVAEENGTTLFSEGAHSTTGHISLKGNIAVQKVALDELVLSGSIPAPEFIKIDVEGAELAVLTGARETLAIFAPVIFLSTHGTDIHRQCCEFLESAGYQLHDIRGKSIHNTREIIAVVPAQSRQ
jgi:FkbM family methyltransferase